MSQNSLVLPISGTLSGLAAVEAINAALDTLNTLNGGASAPASPEAGQLWHDTTNNILKLRSLDNTAWIALVTLDETNHVSNAVVKTQPNLFGLTLSNDTTSPTSVLDIAAGGAADISATAYMRLVSAMKKNVTAGWTAGTTNGALDTGSWASSTFYYVHLIYDAASAAVDVLTSLSYSNPVLPGGYTNFAPIGAILSDASGHVTVFTQDGDDFLFTNSITSLNAVAAQAASQLITLAVPTGTKVRARYRATLAANDSSGTAELSILFTSPDESDQTPSTYDGPASLSLGAYNGVVVAASGEFETRTNISGQIRLRANANYTGSQISVQTCGFKLKRGLQ